jgi:hypothetical protein
MARSAHSTWRASKTSLLVGFIAVRFARSLFSWLAICFFISAGARPNIDEQTNDLFVAASTSQTSRLGSDFACPSQLKLKAQNGTINHWISRSVAALPFVEPGRRLVVGPGRVVVGQRPGGGGAPVLWACLPRVLANAGRHQKNDLPQETGQAVVSGGGGGGGGPLRAELDRKMCPRHRIATLGSPAPGEPVQKCARERGSRCLML